MDLKSRRLATGLSRLLAVLLVVVAIILLFLVPAMLLAWVAPEHLAGDYVARVNGVRIDPTEPGAAGFVLLSANVFLLVAGVILLRLRQVMATVGKGDPFAPANSGRMRTIAGAMAALMAAQLLLGAVVPPALRDKAEVGQLNMGLLLGTLVVLVLSEVFREGARLREEAEGTI